MEKDLILKFYLFDLFPMRPPYTRGYDFWSIEQSRDAICMPSQFWSTDFPSEIYDHVINSLRIRIFGPHSNSSNVQFWSSSISSDGPKLKIRTVYDHVASDYFEFAILVHQNYFNWTKTAYSTSLNVDQKCVFEVRINHMN